METRIETQRSEPTTACLQRLHRDSAKVTICEADISTLSAKTGDLGSFFMCTKIIQGFSIEIGIVIGVPSGKRLQKTMENHHAINGKTHYVYGHFQ